MAKKYIDADLLRKEIEKRLKNIRDYMTGAGMKYKGPKYLKAQGKESAYDALLNILDTLSEEPDKSLEEEIETWIPAHISIRTDETLPLNPTELADSCREWGEGIARHFAEWQKNQMLKDAVEGEVYLYHSYNRDATAILVDIPKENLGDKVRIVVIKEEEE